MSAKYIQQVWGDKREMKGRCKGDAGDAAI